MNNDLMGGLPGQLEEKLDRDIEKILSGDKSDGGEIYFLPSDRRDAIFRNISRKIKPENRFVNSWRTIAAILIPLFILNVTGWLLFLKEPGGTGLKEIYAGRGDKMVVVLPDGSRVWLNSDTRLSYPDNFASGVRFVNLSGEAFFEIESDPDHPFLVHAGDVEIKVLGTTFNVTAYENDNLITSTLEEGKISLSAGLKKKTKYTLIPGETAVYSKDDGSCRIERQSQYQNSSAWKTNQLQFNNTPLPEILKILERRYNVDFEVMDEDLAGYTYTFTSHDETVEEILSGMKAITPIDYIQLGKRKYLVHGNH
ncbi:MAG: DUF4974 domain-containing protein [Bacteroidales bacterium]